MAPFLCRLAAMCNYLYREKSYKLNGKRDGNGVEWSAWFAKTKVSVQSQNIKCKNEMKSKEMYRYMRIQKDIRR